MVTLKRLFVAACIIVLAAQLVRPTIDNPPVKADFSGPADVKAILQRACYNCHSNQTELAWFDKIVPAYWIVAGHVEDGRAVLNFSDWDSLPAAVRKGKLFECLNQMTFNTMPLGSYTAVHHEGRISGEDLATLRAYLLTLPAPNLADTARSGAAMRQFAAWRLSPSAATPPISLNGIAFPTGFEDWEVLATSERWDNGTLRVILANPTAMRAFRNGHTNPWPDSSTFAKIAWDASADTAGHIEAGEFKQVEFMIKDRVKYKSTGGWGWARWVKGLALQPYGKTAAFTSECLNCHAPMKDRDLFFSLPPAPVAPTDGYRVIATSVSHGLTSTLMGDAPAATAARSGRPYPDGSNLFLVTWTQKEDPHWFGANIPADTLRTVRVTVGSSAMNALTDSILTMRPSVLP
ncbi:MAG TPA: cytochrome P460 family protein [Dinghuibacter sp.]|uniref:cytochrome P460 family protein n=1 Tax=Dinghuibacter sp. TaxID=2024697 RepID=UPI002C8C5432|nr:cytochrome P460 family protein [Dinghuibacter sp.]HTJ14624.1 cytochrome P460 family protein [Dinghuibacter sp.]